MTLLSTQHHYQHIMMVGITCLIIMSIASFLLISFQSDKIHFQEYFVLWSTIPNGFCHEMFYSRIYLPECVTYWNNDPNLSQLTKSAQNTSKQFINSSMFTLELSKPINTRNINLTLNQFIKNSSNISVLPLLITSTPRSGTLFTRNLLNRIGLQLQEDWHLPFLDNLNHGMVSWVHIFFDIQNPGFAQIGDMRFKSIWHQTRNPLNSIISLSLTEPISECWYFEYLNKHINLKSISHIINNSNCDTNGVKNSYWNPESYIHKFSKKKK
eukprot:202223_1